MKLLERWDGEHGRSDIPTRIFNEIYFNYSLENRTKYNTTYLKNCFKKYDSIKNKLFEPGKSLLDIFLIWELNKEDFNDFLATTFYGRKIKYAIITTEDFYKRLEYWDKLIKNILTENGNTFLKDNLKIKEKLWI